MFTTIDTPKEEVIKQALSVLSDQMLLDLVAFCATTEVYRESELHRLCLEVLEERQP